MTTSHVRVNTRSLSFSLFFFFNYTPPTEIYTLSLHDALPISDVDRGARDDPRCEPLPRQDRPWPGQHRPGDRKSTRLNSSHQIISYAVFCLKKKKKIYKTNINRYKNLHTYSLPYTPYHKHHIC